MERRSRLSSVLLIRSNAMSLSEPQAEASRSRWAADPALPGDETLSPREIALLAAQYVDVHARYIEERAQLLAAFRDDRVPLESFVQKLMSVTSRQRHLHKMRERIGRLSNQIESMDTEARLAV